MKHSKVLTYSIGIAITLLVFCLSICLGSVTIPLGETLQVLGCSFASLFSGQDALQIMNESLVNTQNASIIMGVRLPRALCVALEGAALSLAGASMQGLLKNPLADGSTLGVSSGAALGAAVSMVLGLSFAALPFAGTVVMAVAFAFVSLLIILGLAKRLDNSLSTNTIILIGVIFSMLVNSLMSILVTFSGDKLKSITFWMMGSLAGSSYENAAFLAVISLVAGAVLCSKARELNAFAIGEDNARHVGVDVKRVKLEVLIAASALIGVCVAVGGTIAFVGLVTPHMVRLITGPNHKYLLPACIFGGAVFLMLSDMVARCIAPPLELPIGVVTSLVGAVVFIIIFWRMRERG